MESECQLHFVLLSRQGSSSSAATKTISSSISTTTVHERATNANSNVPDIVSHIHNEASQQQQQPQPHRPPRRKKKSSISQVRYIERKRAPCIYFPVKS